MALHVFQASAVVAAGFLLYVLLYVGRRGRNFPDGKSGLRQETSLMSNESSQDLPLYR